MKKLVKKVLMIMTVTSMLLCVNVVNAAEKEDSNSKYLTSILEKTLENYSQELVSLFEGNPVYNKLAEISLGSYIESIISDEFVINIIDDIETKNFVASMLIPGIPEAITMYLNDSSLILGYGESLNFEIDPLNLGSDLISFMEINQSILGLEVLEEIAIFGDIIDEIDFSYSGLKTSYENISYDGLNSICDSFSATFEGLINRADFIMDKSEIELESGLVECDLISLEIDLPRIIDWLKTDLRTAVVDNDAIEALFVELKGLNDMIMFTDYDFDYGKLRDEYDALMNELGIMDAEDEDVLMFLDLYVYEDTIVGAYIGVEEDEELNSLGLGFVGAENRLDSIFGYVETEGEIIQYVSIETDRSDPEVFKSYIETFDYYSDSVESCEIEWDTKETVDNFSIKVSYESEDYEYEDGIAFTFALDGDKIIWEQTFEYPFFSIIIEALNFDIELPTDVIMIRDVNLMEIIVQLQSIFEAIE